MLIQPAIEQAIKNHDKDERQKIMAPTYEFNLECLSNEQYELFKSTWCETNLIKIENKEMEFPPLKKPG